MKPRLPRKITSSARINLNRFWNELEDFYTRREERRQQLADSVDKENLDTAREEEENALNERLEAEADSDDDPFIFPGSYLRLSDNDLMMPPSPEPSEEEPKFLGPPNKAIKTPAMGLPSPLGNVRRRN